MQLAIALYNNDVDDEDELEFRKGDILNVLIENPNGLNGWWLCEHNGKCGLCPANRLKFISSTIKSNETIRSSSCLSTASMYDSLSNDYDIPITASSHDDYDIPQGSDFISNSNAIPTTMDSSPESSSRSSGIYSTIDFHLSDFSSLSSSSDFHTSILNGNNHNRLLSSIEIDQLQDYFRKLSIRSLLLDKYRQLTSKSNIDTNYRIFISECRLFLHDYGFLLDRHTYKILKENYLYELEHMNNNNNQKIIQLSTQIIQLIKPIIEIRIKQKHNSYSSIPIDVFKKLNLEPIEEITNENDQQQKKMTTSLSTTQIYGNFQNKKSIDRIGGNSFRMTTSKTCHSNFLSETNNDNKSDDYDYIDDDYSTSPTITDPLVKCYHRHIREHISTMFIRYTRLSQLNQLQTSLLVNEGKALIVAGHKLVFVLETLQEHIRNSSKFQKFQPAPLIQLTGQLCDALTSFIRLLKQFSNQNCTNIQKFQHDTQMIMNIVKRIKQQCSSV